MYKKIILLTFIFAVTISGFSCSHFTSQKAALETCSILKVQLESLKDQANIAQASANQSFTNVQNQSLLQEYVDQSKNDVAMLNDSIDSALLGCEK